MSSFFPFDKKTIRKYIHNYVVRIARIPVISLDDRFCNAPPGKKVLLLLNRTDCPYHDGRPVDKVYWSHKLNRAALRYKVGVCIYSSRIAWVAGGVKAGANPDITITRNHGILDKLGEGEGIVADNGYEGEPDSINTPILGKDLIDYEKRYNTWVRKILARHEIFNKRLKKFQVLNVPFCHKEEFHRDCFMACAVMTQLCIQVEPISDVGFNF